jgi:curli biogenesis system outer membrane secretion channel CsgG
MPIHALGFTAHAFLVGVLVLWPGAAESQDRPVRVAVLDFENTSEYWGPDLAKKAADQLVTELVQLGRFDVIERSQLEAVLAEQDISATETSDLALALGRVGTVDYLIIGTISRFSVRTVGAFGARLTEAESRLNARVINTENARIEGAFEGSGRTRGAGYGNISINTFDAGLAQATLDPAVDDLARQIGTLDLQVVAGTEAPIIVGGGVDGTVYISQGENVGMQLGQRFEVLRVVDEIVVGGEVVDVRTETVGIIEVREVLSRSSICAVVEGEAAEGDTLIPL